MAKVKLPSWLLEVAGSLEKMDLTFRRFKGRQILETLPAPSYTRSEKQDQQRNKFTQAVKLWHSMTEEEKEPYREIARQLGITPYNAFLREKLRAEEVGIWYKVTINNTGSALTDYQILLNISEDSTFFEDCESKKEAIRVYDEDKTTELSYWIEEWDTTNNNAKIWIKVPSIPGSSTKTIYISVDPSRTEDASNGDDTFLFFDDFEGTSLDTSKWVEVTGVNTQITNSILELWEDSSNHDAIRSSTSFSHPKALRAKAKLGSYDGSQVGFSNMYDSGNDDLKINSQDGYSTYTFYCRKDGTSTAYSTGKAKDDEWHIIDVIWTGGIATSKLLIDGGYETTVSASYDPTDDLKVLLRQYVGPNRLYVDWIFVREYTDPEPTVSYSKL